MNCYKIRSKKEIRDKLAAEADPRWPIPEFWGVMNTGRDMWDTAGGASKALKASGYHRGQSLTDFEIVEFDLVATGKTIPIKVKKS